MCIYANTVFVVNFSNTFFFHENIDISNRKTTNIDLKVTSMKSLLFNRDLPTPQMTKHYNGIWITFQTFWWLRKKALPYDKSWNWFDCKSYLNMGMFYQMSSNFALF